MHHPREEPPEQRPWEEVYIPPRAAESLRLSKLGLATSQSDMCWTSQGSARILPGTSVREWPREVQSNIRVASHSSDVEVLKTVGEEADAVGLPT